MKFLKQIFCKHKYKYEGMEKCSYNKYFFYRCEKCGRVEVVDVGELKAIIEYPSIDILKKSCGLWGEIIFLPRYVALPIEGDIKYVSKVVALLVDRYRKRGIDIKAYGEMRGAAEDD